MGLKYGKKFTQTVSRWNHSGVCPPNFKAILRNRCPALALCRCLVKPNQICDRLNNTVPRLSDFTGDYRAGVYLTSRRHQPSGTPTSRSMEKTQHTCTSLKHAIYFTYKLIGIFMVLFQPNPAEVTPYFNAVLVVMYAIMSMGFALKLFRLQRKRLQQSICSSGVKQLVASAAGWDGSKSIAKWLTE